MSRQITVVGGGIAGLTAAITAAEQGGSVRLVEERRSLGGRAVTTAPPYRANLGPHALYDDGVLWKWLNDCHLLPATVARGNTKLQLRRAGMIGDLPELAGAFKAIIPEEAPPDRSFREWLRTRIGSDATELLIGFAFIPTYDADAGRLSAAFVHERLRRVLQPNVAHYVVGGWQALVERLSDRAESLGVTIETGNKVTEIPAPPVVVATGQAAARRLLGETIHESALPRVTLYDLAFTGETALPSGLLDLDERIYAARYTAFDRTLAPRSQGLVQIACGCRPGERLADAQARIERLLDSVYSTWRRQLCWSRRSLVAGATGAVDLPGSTWRDRPEVMKREGIYRAGDYVAAPGFFSEVSFVSGREAGHAAVAYAQARRQTSLVSPQPR